MTTHRPADVAVDHVVWRCHVADCGLRFPAVARDAPAACPACGGDVERAMEVPTRPPRPSVPRHGVPVAGLLDNVRSALNVGAMMRTADAAGLVHVHLCGITAPGDHPTVAKTALGAEQAVAWTHHPDATAVVDDHRSAGWVVCALEVTPDARPLGADTTVADADTTGVLLVVGHEVAGVDPGVLAAADHVLAIPQHGTKRSLNVATAFGIAAYLLDHRR